MRSSTESPVAIAWTASRSKASFRASSIPAPGAFPGAHAVSLRVFIARNHSQSARLIEAYRHCRLNSWSINRSGWKTKAVRDVILRLHLARALGHLGMGQLRGVPPSRTESGQPPNGGPAAQVHRAVWVNRKSDYQIFLDILTRLGLGAMFSEGGCSELDWCKRSSIQPICRRS